jgi:hypothetical protein
MSEALLARFIAMFSIDAAAIVAGRFGVIGSRVDA